MKEPSHPGSRPPSPLAGPTWSNRLESPLGTESPHGFRRGHTAASAEGRTWWAPEPGAGTVLRQEEGHFLWCTGERVWTDLSPRLYNGRIPTGRPGEGQGRRFCPSRPGRSGQEASAPHAAAAVIIFGSLVSEPLSLVKNNNQISPGYST